MIQEAYAGPYPNVLGARQLGGMVTRRLGGDGRVGRNALGGEFCIVWKRIEGAAVKGEGDLDLGLVGVAVYEGCAA